MTSRPHNKSVPLHLINRSLRRLRRGVYELRSFVPGMRFHHQCERMIGPVGYWNELQQYQLNVLLANGLKPHHSVLDVGCGPLQGGIPFIGYLESSRYTGVDITLTHIKAAYRQIIRHDLASKNPRLIHSPVFGDEYLAEASFDFVWVSQLLYLFDEKTMVALLDFVRRRLRPGGKFLGDIVNPDKHESVAANYSDYVQYSLESINRLAQAAGLRVRSLGEILQYQYPAKLTLRQSLMLEFTLLP